MDIKSRWGNYDQNQICTVLYAIKERLKFLNNPDRVHPVPYLLRHMKLRENRAPER